MTESRRRRERQQAASPRRPAKEPVRVPRAFASPAARALERPLGRVRPAVTPARALGVLGMLVALVAAYALVSGPAFVLAHVEPGELRYTDPAAVVERLGVEPGAHLFAIDAHAAAARIERLPSVLSATVSLTLPDTLTVAVVERVPIVGWQVEGTTYLVDREGLLFAVAPGSPTRDVPTPDDGPGDGVQAPDGSAAPGGPAPTGAAGSPSPSSTPIATPSRTPGHGTASAAPAGSVAPADSVAPTDTGAPAGSAGPLATADPSLAALPVVVDARSSAVWLGVGSHLSTLDLEVATRIASITPADLGSRADALAFRIDDADGFTVTGEPGLWTAVFGTYLPDVRPPDIIPGQVRLLRSLLSGRETSVARVVLADESNGTWVPRKSP